MLRSGLAVSLALAFAMVWGVPRASAADAIFTVSNVHIDASGYSASAAQGVAFQQGRPKAWQIVYRRLTRQQDWDKQPQLDDTHLQRLIRSFKIANERQSTTRYTADITYSFNPAAVAKVLREANIAFTTGAAHRILLVPMAPQYSKSSAWTRVFTAPRFAEAVVPFSLPVGDAADAAPLAHLVFETAAWGDIAPVALRVHATEAVLVQLQIQPSQHKIALGLKRLGVGQVPMQSTAGVSYVQTATAAYPAAADAAMAAISEMWKQRAAVDYSQRGNITVDVRVGSLSQWAVVQAALVTVSNVTASRVIAMDIGDARMAISFLGTTDQLRDALAQAGLQLTNSEPTNTGEWLLHVGSPASSQSAAARPAGTTRP
ncbi:MAG: hypothetical protein JOZ55_08385 [Alphaproteobacteria bacterium]|nr:hypothetical protein [Alphaproteobacteria bacterium]